MKIACVNPVSPETLGSLSEMQKSNLNRFLVKVHKRI